jgi:O-methyltransferase
MFAKQRQLLTEMIDVARLQAELGQVFPSADERKRLLAQIRRVRANVECPHNESHVLSFIVELFRLKPEVEGVIVEAGCYKGGSTAKISLAASILGRDLVVFDSFEGLPENQEPHDSSLLGHSIKGWFDRGNFAGALEEVRHNVETYGDIRPVRFVKGWFDDTMPGFTETICAAYLDVDLAASTRTCLKYLYPRLAPGGLLMSQDGDFPLVVDVFRDREFWEDEVGFPMPVVEGLGTKKILKIVKPAGVGSLAPV